MQITIVLDTNDTSDLAGLTALIDALSGRTVMKVNYAVATPDRPPVAPDPAEFAPHVTAEALLQQEANRVAGEATGLSVAGTGGPQFDSSGLPWDERIHGKSSDGSLPTNANGTWRKRRGVDDATVARVEAELRGRTPAVPDVPNVPETTPQPPVVTAPVSSAATSAAEAPAPPVPAPPTGGMTFAQFVAEANKFGKNYAELNALSGQLGVPAFKDMKDRPDLFDMFLGMLG